MTSTPTAPRHPIFIVGSARSGTSAMVNALIAAGYHGFREGHFLPLAYRFDVAIDQHFNSSQSENPKVLMAHIDKGKFKSAINQVVRDTVDGANPQSPWFDKTGGAEMIRLLPTLLSMWPSAGFLFLKRRAIENILSRTKKFPKHSFDHHCTEWAKNMAAWREVRELLPKDRFIEIDQYDMINSAKATASALSRFLGKDHETAVAIEALWQRTRPQETGADSAKRIWTLEATGWTDPQVSAFKKLCTAEMAAYGYTLGIEYRT